MKDVELIILEPEYDIGRETRKSRVGGGMKRGCGRWTKAGGSPARWVRKRSPSKNRSFLAQGERAQAEQCNGNRCRVIKEGNREEGEGRS